MKLILQLAAAAGLAAFALSALPAPAEAQYRSSPYGQTWNGPEGHFLVNARACPDLREDFRDRRQSYGRYNRHSDWRDRRVLECPPRAWSYVPSYRERRMGRTGDQLRPDVAYFDRRTGQYAVQTRWGAVPVQVTWDQGQRSAGFNRGNRHDSRPWGWRH
jgi:hypothetical protein